MSPVNGERHSRDAEKILKRDSSRSPCNDVSSRGSVASSSAKHKVSPTALFSLSMIGFSCISAVLLLAFHADIE